MLTDRYSSSLSFYDEQDQGNTSNNRSGSAGGRRSMSGLHGILAKLPRIRRNPPHRLQHYRTISKTRPFTMIPEIGQKVAR
jgi:hypothetical protein